MSLLIVGCGYVGKHVVETYLTRCKETETSPEVYAATRTANRVPELESWGVKPIVCDWTQAHEISKLPHVKHVLVSVPHREVEPHGIDSHVVGLRSICEWLTSDARLIYLSTTGVYGSVSNEKVDETTPVSPTRIGPQIAVQAEQWLEKNAPLNQFATLRLAGIYGAGRVPLAAKLKAGEALSVPRHGHLNLIHVKDISKIICTMFDRIMEHSLYVLSDGHPVPRDEFYRELAQQCGVDEPVFEIPDENDPRQRRATDKRVDPSRIINELEIRLDYPNYRLGLEQALERL